jgi:hypothetical protein
MPVVAVVVLIIVRPVVLEQAVLAGAEPVERVLLARLARLILEAVAVLVEQAQVHLVLAVLAAPASSSSSTHWVLLRS